MYLRNLASIMRFFSRTALIPLTLCSIALTRGPVAAADLSFSFGLFKFDATDYYFPNFYAEAGFRGEIDYVPDWGGASRHNLRLQCHGYPMDDNIFEPIVEYGLRWPGPFHFGGWELELMPAARLFGVASRLSHVSTGGGASLKYLEGEPLAAIAVLDRK